jgi:hypothetical protein
MATVAAITTASGARFGRIITANAVAAPAAIAAPCPGRTLITHASAQKATPGTSLNGIIACWNVIGVAAMRNAATTPPQAVDI